MSQAIGDETARTMRRAWFDYLDTVEPVRPRLHAYCLKLTSSVFDAEDLVQETLLRGFGAIGRGDLHAGTNPVQSASAYLSRVATNLYIDGERRRAREAGEAQPVEASEDPRETSVLTAAAGSALFARATPQERAAVVLKDVFDFDLAEIARILATTVGAVKAALHRGREKFAGERRAASRPRGTPASAALVDAFIAAFNARDIKAVTGLLLESTVYEARGVGGEEGRDVTWVKVNITRPDEVVFERHYFEGEHVSVGVAVRGGRRRLLGFSRLEETDGLISRHVGYFFCPETLALVAEALGMSAANHGYHQDAETLERMIGATVLPWADPPNVA